MTGTWIDYGIIIAIIVFGLFIMYRALKEPMDLLFGFIGKGFSWLGSALSSGGGKVKEVIRYE
jgi:hypothetical protein